LASNFESDVHSIIITIATAASELHRTAEGMQCTVANVKHLSETSEKASKHTSGTVQSVSNSVEEMSSSVKEIAEQISKSAELVTETVSQTQKADQAAKILSSAVVQISGILELIQGIAGQINYTC
jgi:methyl-accepting chemotaxis protein